jgi:hypothetical protein
MDAEKVVKGPEDRLVKIHKRALIQAAFVSLLAHGVVISGLFICGLYGMASWDANVQSVKLAVLFEAAVPAIPDKLANLAATGNALPIPANDKPKSERHIADNTAARRGASITHTTPEPVGLGSAGHGIVQPAPDNSGGATTFFGIATNAQSIVYVIDHSASMGLNGGLAAARKELTASLEMLPAGVRFQVIAYNRQVDQLPGSGFRVASRENRRQALDWINSLRAEGGTDATSALRRAIGYHPDVIFFLSDGDGIEYRQLRAVTRLNGGRTVIHAIGLRSSSQAPEDLALKTLTTENRGSYRNVILGN